MAIKDYLEIDLEYFISSTVGLQSNQVRVKSWPAEPSTEEVMQATPTRQKTAEEEIDMIDRIICDLPVTKKVQTFTEREYIEDIKKSFDYVIPDKIILRPITGFPGYNINNFGVIHDVHGKKIELVHASRRAKPSVLLFAEGRMKHVDMATIFKKAFPELHP